MPRQVDHGERRRVIIDALRRCVARDGHAAVTLREVAAEAGISIGRVQHYFAGKDELLAGAVADEAARTARRLAAEADLGPDAHGRDRVRAFALSLLPLDRERRTGALIRRSCPPTGRAHQAAGEERLHAELVEAGARGELPRRRRRRPRGTPPRRRARRPRRRTARRAGSPPHEATATVDYVLARAFAPADAGTPARPTARVTDGEEPAPTAQRIVRAAERHFAEHGIGGASLRDIIRDAGQANAGAVQYYFGDRLGLARAVIARTRPREVAHRHALLDAYEQAGATDVHGLADALVTPLAALLDEPDGGRDYLRINAEYFVTVSRGDQWRNPIPDTSIPRWHDLLDRIVDGRASAATRTTLGTAPARRPPHAHPVVGPGRSGTRARRPLLGLVPHRRRHRRARHRRPHPATGTLADIPSDAPGTACAPADRGAGPGERAARISTRP